MPSNTSELSYLGIQNPPVEVNGQTVTPPELVYEIVDAKARAMADTAGNNLIAWKGDAEPVVAYIPAGVKVTYQDTEYTGTLQPDDQDVQTKSRYLVYRGQTEDGDNMYQEYIVVKNPQDADDVWWEPVGFQDVNLKDLGQMAFVDAVMLNKGTGANVLGENTQFTATAPTVSVNAPKAGIFASIKTNVAVGADGTANAVTGYPNPVTETFVGSVSNTKKKLKTTSIQEAGEGVNLNTKVTPSSSKMVTKTITAVDGTETVSKVTKGTSKMMKTSVRGVAGTETVSKVTKTTKKMVTDTVPNVTGVGTLPSFNTSYDSSAKKLTLQFSAGSLPTLGTAKTVATGALAADGGGADVVDSVSITDKTVATADANATSVATGELSGDGTGATIVNEVNISDKTVAKAAAAPTTVATGELDAAGSGATVVKEVTVGSQVFATVKATQTTVATGKVGTADTNGDDVVTEVSPTNGTNPAITGLGTPNTAAALTGVKVTQQPAVEIQSASQGQGNVDVVTDASATATAPTVSAGNNDRVKVATYDALSVQAGDIPDYNDVPM